MTGGNNTLLLTVSVGHRIFKDPKYSIMLAEGEDRGRHQNRGSINLM